MGTAACGLKAVAFSAMILIASATGASAALTFTTGKLTSGIGFILVSGSFDFDQNLSHFTRLVKETDPVFVAFNSPGGNPPKAMELGRLIRALGLATFQPRQGECASACALAFLGGTIRYAEPGAIGVHKSSFADSRGMDLDSAVSYVQHITAETISYMTEMGVDPALLQLSLKYESDDIRYLSKSEMAEYRVTTKTDKTSADLPESGNSISPPTSDVPPTTRALPDSSIPNLDARFDIPRAKTGRFRHPKGFEFLRDSPSQQGSKLGMLRNRDRVAILSISDRWYKVRVGTRIGYLHHNWVKVDQFINNQFDDRYIQIASFDNFAEAENYIRNAPLPLTAYLAANHWFAVTASGTFPAKQAAEMLKQMKAKASAPEDAFITVGNTYVRKVCCD
ncbi:hypothetical protein DUT91_24115 [Phyllobacterium salinisoli]|uniref:SH3b domain-containing protein n=1 Tax=Phyllobacterium salinisoli TaxID=1899321 RepID=A0A368JWV2_9HYPH|nr:SH3 domain-containing protein [Phyllobacterium salinisoli]RCS21431.1 hypothetical protein DUT91_24115 [Phyllobacterium salinisoli]